MQRIIIKNFGPIKEVDLEIKDFLVFIGPQASGKSTIAKVIYFFKSLRDDLEKIFFEFAKKKIDEFYSFEEFEKQITENFTTKTRKKISEIWDIETLQNAEIIFQYSLQHRIKISINKKGLDLDLTNNLFRVHLKKIFEIVKENIPKLSKIGNKQSERALKDLYKSTFLESIISENNAFFSESFNKIDFIPASRSSLIKISKEFMYDLDELDLFSKKFLKEIVAEIRESATFKTKGILSLISYQNNSLIQQLSLNIIKGTYVYDEEEEEDIMLIQKSENELVKLHFNNLSSGQQESLWIIQYVISTLLMQQIQKGEPQSLNTIIEEPEAHLYPEAQKDIVSLIALLSNSADNQVIITTHSPYILSSVDNLMYAYKYGQKNETKVTKIVDKRLWLDPKRVGVYFVDNGTIEDIKIADETGKTENGNIKIERIDSVSKIINNEFEALVQTDEEVYEL